MNGEREPYRVLRSVRATVTIQCRSHGTHTATVQGPLAEVLDAIGTLHQVCADQDRWVIVEYAPSEEHLAMAVSEWT